MTQRDPDPASLPEAIPLLSYERQTDDGAMDWVVRFIGAWIICNGAASVIAFCVEQASPIRFSASLGPSGATFLAMLSGVTSILFGIAILRRQRYGFYGRLSIIALYPVISLIPSLLTRPGIVLLSILLTTGLQAAVTFAAVLSILRRADTQGLLQPVRMDRPCTQPEGDSIGFLISRQGWMALAQGGTVVIHLAMWPLLIWGGVSVAKWSWQSTVQVTMLLALALGGLMMCQRRVWSLWPVAVLLPLATVIGPILAMWQYASPGGLPVSAIAIRYLPQFLSAVTSAYMLCLLARKAERSDGVMS